jgi:hypothetical protein
MRISHATRSFNRSFAAASLSLPGYSGPGAVAASAQPPSGEACDWQASRILRHYNDIS